MATVPGEMPLFDFGPEQAYNVELLTDTVIWPLIDHYARADWRAQSQPNDTLSVPSHGQHQGKMLDILISAECGTEAVSDEAFRKIHTARLQIEETALEPVKGILLHSVQGALQEFYEAAPDDHDEDEHYHDLVEWLQGDEDDLLVKKGAIYTFDSDNHWNVELFRAVQDACQQVNVPASRAERDVVSQGKLYLPELETIQLGLLALKAPESMLQAIENVKDRPIAYH